jgi:hypothetical protein
MNRKTDMDMDMDKDMDMSMYTALDMMSDSAPFGPISEDQYQALSKIVRHGYPTDERISCNKIICTLLEQLSPGGPGGRRGGGLGGGEERGRAGGAGWRLTG